MFTAVVALIGFVAGVVHVAKHGFTSLVSTLPSGLTAGLIVVLSYFVAAALAAPAYYLLKQISNRWFGRVLLWGVCGSIVYGAVGLTSVLAYVHLGINLMDYDSAADAWRSLVPVTAILGLLTAVLGPLVSRYF